MASTDRQRCARVPPHLAWKHPGLPRDWVLVLERNEDAMRPEPLPGYVWLDTRGKRTHVWAEHLEIRDMMGDRLAPLPERTHSRS